MAFDGLGFTVATAAATGNLMSMITESKFDKLATLPGKHNYAMVTILTGCVRVLFCLVFFLLVLQKGDF